MTTAEIATKLGISRGTVSRVLNNQPNVKEETRQKVLEALKALNYKPNETARSLVMSRKFHIAVIVFSEPTFFWNQVKSGVDAAHSELISLGVKVDFFTTDIMRPEEQLELIRTLPSQGYDGIAIAPNDPALLSGEIDQLSNSGFPVVIINVEIPSANQLCYIGCDYTQSGILASELFSKLLTNDSKILILTLEDNVNSIEQRISGFRKNLPLHEHLSIKRIQRYSRSGHGVYESLLEILSEDSDIQGIYVSFGALEQVARAVETLRPLCQFVVIGYDLNEDIYHYLKSGSVSATICHEPFNQGYYSVKILHQYLHHQILPSSSLMYNKLEVLFASNAKYYINEIGKWNWYHNF